MNSRHARGPGQHVLLVVLKTNVCQVMIAVKLLVWVHATFGTGRYYIPNTEAKKIWTHGGRICIPLG